MDDDTCVCPVCGQEIPPEEIDIEEHACMMEYDAIAHAQCPRCGHVSTWVP